MSCPIPITIVNPHYKKLSEELDVPLDDYSHFDDFTIDVPCGRCYHCRKSYKTHWNLRLQLEYNSMTPKQRDNSFFVTLTFTNSTLPSQHPTKKQISPIIRRFLENVRYRYERSVRHWIVSEYGDTTGRFHLHGILFDIPFDIRYLEELWSNGWVSYRRLNPKRITYVTTYINKLSKGSLLELPNQRQFVFASPGIGKSWTADDLNRRMSYVDGTPSPFMYYNNRPFAMPRYFRHKIFTERDLESLKTAYFANYSDDVIPEGPYILGTRKYDDYSLYRIACEELKDKYNDIYRYGKRKSKPPIEAP